MFDNKMYTQIVGIIHMAIKQTLVSSDSFESEFVSHCFDMYFASFN